MFRRKLPCGLSNQVTDKAVTALKGTLGHTREFVATGRTAFVEADSFDRLAAESSADPILVAPQSSVDDVAPESR